MDSVKDLAFMAYRIILTPFFAIYCVGFYLWATYKNYDIGIVYGDPNDEDVSDLDY